MIKIELSKSFLTQEVKNGKFINHRGYNKKAYRKSHRLNLGKPIKPKFLTVDRRASKDFLTLNSTTTRAN
jgi:hypothetical protein